MRKPILALLVSIAACSSPQKQASQPPAETKLWNNDNEKVRFMLKMTHHLVAAVRDECIDRVINRLNGKEAKQTHAFDELMLVGFSPLMAQAKRAEPAKEAAASDICASSLQSCGTCHLPRVNNCTYRITLKDKGSFVGRVVGDGEKLKFQPNDEGASASDIAPNQIAKTEWLNGGDDITTWWNFKKLGAKARIVKKMMAMAAKNNVGCTNCHLQHGNFALNDNGKFFDQTGEIKRTVSIADFVR